MPGPTHRQACKSVLEDGDLLHCILSRVDTCQDGWSFRQWAAVSSVCKQWRRAMLRQPVQLHLVACDDPSEQAVCLLSCTARVRTLSCLESGFAALALLRDPGFQQRNSQHLHRLDLHDAEDPQDFLQTLAQPGPLYPQLQHLVLDTTAAMLQLAGHFSVACLSALTSLTTLAIASFPAPHDLSWVPASLQHLMLSLPVDVTQQDVHPADINWQLPCGLCLRSLQITGDMNSWRVKFLYVDASALLLAEEVSVLVANDTGCTSVTILGGGCRMDFWAQLAASPVQRLTIQADAVYYRGVNSAGFGWPLDQEWKQTAWRQRLASMGWALTMRSQVRSLVQYEAQRIGFHTSQPALVADSSSWKLDSEEMTTLLSAEVPFAQFDFRNSDSGQIQELLTHPTFLERMAPHVTALLGLKLNGDWLALVANSYPKLERLEVKLQPNAKDPSLPHGAYVPSGIRFLELWVPYGLPRAYCARQEFSSTSRALAVLLEQAALKFEAKRVQALAQALCGLPFSVASVTLVNMHPRL